MYVLEYQNQIIADRIDVYQNGVLKASTNGEVSYGSNSIGGGGSTFDIDKLPLRFMYNSANGNMGQIIITTSNTKTVWNIYSHCPVVNSLNTTYTLTDANYSYLFSGLKNNTNYKLVIEYITGKYPIPYVYYSVLSAAGPLGPPALPIVYGNTADFPANITFNSGGVVS